MSIVCKFGGSALTPHNVGKIKAIVNDNPDRRYVVVSAMGGFGNQPKTTDLLIALSRQVNSPKELTKHAIYAEIRRRYISLINACGLHCDCDELMWKAFNGFACCDAPFIRSRGEYLSAFVISQYLGYTFIDAADAVFFNRHGKLRVKATLDALRNAAKGKRVVLGGYYGSCLSSITTFERGGSDVSGAYLAAAVNAKLYENYIDVDGLMLISPRIISCPLTLPYLSYSQLQQINQLNAAVLHRDSVLPLIKKGTPIRLLNLYNPTATGTTICHKPFNGLITITEERALCITLEHPSEFAPNALPNKLLTARYDKGGGTFICNEVQALQLLQSYQKCKQEKTECFYTHILSGSEIDYSVITDVVKERDATLYYLDYNKNACSLATNRRISDLLYKRLM